MFIITASIVNKFFRNVFSLVGQTPSKLAKGIADNETVISLFSPGLWKAVEKKSKDSVQRLVSNWVKIDETRDGRCLLDLAAEKGEKKERAEILKILKEEENTVKIVHCCLAGDRQAMRSLLRNKGDNIKAISTSYLDQATGDFLPMPLIGEAALLGLTAVVRKLLRKKASLDLEVGTTPLYLYVLQRIQPEKKFYDLMEIMLFKCDFSEKPGEEIDAVLDACYEKKVPLDILRLLAANGLDIFAADCNGHFLRDRILMRHATVNPRALAKELAYVDEIVIDMAENGGIEMIHG